MGRWAMGLSVGLLAVAAVAWLARLPLSGAALTAGLKRAGAGDIQFSMARASLWDVEIDDLSFRVRTQAFSAHRVTLVRTHWWLSSLGTVRVEGARIPVVADGSDVNPRAWASYSGQAVPADSTSLPADELSIDGLLAIQAAGLPDQPVAVGFAAKKDSPGQWQGSAHVTGPGLAADVTGQYSGAEKRVSFHVSAASLDLKTWRDIIQRIVVLPGGMWEAAGVLGGTANGTYADHKITLGGNVHLREGSFSNTARGVSLAGVEGEVEFTDFNDLRSKPGNLRARELRSGPLVATGLDFGVAFNGPHQIDVSRARLQLLGGALTAEPFTLHLDRNELEATVTADGLDISEILAMSKDIPATAVGRVNGRLPIRIDSAGLRFGTGWLELKSGVRAEVQLKAAGLLTNGVSQTSASYPMLQKVENGLLRLHLTELRVDVRPPNAPPGRSAQLHLVGEPGDPTVKAPVILDLNINGPLEQLVNFGLDRRVSFGPGK